MNIRQSSLAIVIFLAIALPNTLYADWESERMKERYNIEEEEVWEYDVEITFYTDLTIENSKYGSVDSLGNTLNNRTIAIPYEFELGTQWEFESHKGMVFNATDRGSRKYIRTKEDKTLVIDMCIMRNRGESDKEYYKRVNRMGRIKTKGRIL